MKLREFWAMGLSSSYIFELDWKFLFILFFIFYRQAVIALDGSFTLVGSFIIKLVIQ